MAFTRLTRDARYTDILAVGVNTMSQEVKTTHSHYLERMESYAIQRMAFQNGELRPVDDMLLFTGSDLWDSVLTYSGIRHNSLVVCNHTLIAIGSSDFTQCLENNRLMIAENKVNADDYGLTDQGEICSKQFIASFPPTIIGLLNTSSGRRLTVVDIANYGIKYMIDIWNNLPEDERKLVPNYAELGVSVDNAETCCALIARYMQEYYKVVHHYKLGGLALTYAGQGMRAFRRRFYRDNILTHKNEKARILEGKCYTGGRCEYRFKGHYNENAYLLDVRSMYPAIARQKAFPVELLDYQESPTEYLIDSWLSKGLVFAYCHVDTPEPAFPVRRFDKTFFPVGRFNTFLCGEEFKEAWKNGYVTRVYRASVHRTEQVLSEYSEFMLRARTELKVANNKLAERIVKFITNGIWGQFGKINNAWVCTDDITPDRQYGGFIRHDKERNSESHYRIIDWEVSRLTHGIWCDNTYPAISAVMNSYCRHQLYRHALLAGLSNVLYFSIDGMIVTQDGFDRLQWLISHDDLQYGTYKISEFSNSCYIQDVGVYKIGNKVAFQGVPELTCKVYKGFWSVVSDKLPESNLPSETGKSVSVIEYPLPDRSRLGEDDKLPGRFMPLSVLDELPFLSLDDNHPTIQPSFHFGEWQR